MLASRLFRRPRLAPVAASSVLRSGLPALPPFLPPSAAVTSSVPRRAASRYQAFDSGFDPDDLQAARRWRQTFAQDALPKGSTAYSRSSGPGGQHVNKTESKATTSWPVGELARALPALLHAGLRTSRYYTKATDSLTMQAQEQRSRSANAEANRQKLYEELVALYEAAVPGEARPETAAKYRAVEKSFHETRVKDKKRQSSKKQSRRGGGFEG